MQSGNSNLSVFGFAKWCSSARLPAACLLQIRNNRYWLQEMPSRIRMGNGHYHCGFLFSNIFFLHLQASSHCSMSYADAPGHDSSSFLVRK